MDKREIEDYKVVGNSLDYEHFFKAEVLKLLSEGYMLQGGLAVSRGWLYQALVKYKE